MDRDNKRDITDMKEEQEFSRLVGNYKSTIYTVCYMFSKNNDEVQDLFQDVLANLWNGYESFRQDSKTNTWVWRVAMNTCISQERKKKRRPARAQLSVGFDLYADSDNDTNGMYNSDQILSRASETEKPDG